MANTKVNYISKCSIKMVKYLQILARGRMSIGRVGVAIMYATLKIFTRAQMT